MSRLAVVDNGGIPRLWHCFIDSWSDAIWLYVTAPRARLWVGPLVQNGCAIPSLSRGLSQLLLVLATERELQPVGLAR